MANRTFSPSYKAGFLAGLARRHAELFTAAKWSVAVGTLGSIGTQMFMGMTFGQSLLGTIPGALVFCTMQYAQHRESVLAKKMTDVILSRLHALDSCLEHTFDDWTRLLGDHPAQGLRVELDGNDVTLMFHEDGEHQVTFTVSRHQRNVSAKISYLPFCLDRRAPTLDLHLVDDFVLRVACDVAGLFKTKNNLLTADSTAKPATQIDGPAGTAFETALRRLRADAVAGQQAAYAAWFVGLANKTQLVCDRLLALDDGALGPEHAERHTLEDYLVPQMTALLANAKRFASDTDIPADQEGLAGLQDALTRLVDHFDRAANNLRDGALQNAVRNTARAVAVLDRMDASPRSLDKPEMDTLSLASFDRAQTV